MPGSGPSRRIQEFGGDLISPWIHVTAEKIVGLPLDRKWLLEKLLFLRDLWQSVRNRAIAGTFEVTCAHMLVPETAVILVAQEESSEFPKKQKTSR